ncbi:MAG: 2-oxoglutarate and iron-dependent oxygenase domain-containing protein [Novosphingobium sp.]
MQKPALKPISLAADQAGVTAELGASLRRFGFAMVRDHGIDPALIARGRELTAEFFALPLAEKQRYFLTGQGGARGYTPFGTEIAKGADRHDLKEFWHVGRDLPPGHRLEATMPSNVWADQIDGFRETFTQLYAEFDRAGSAILSCIALDLGLDARWFNSAIADGNSVLRLLHYPPIANAPAGAIRAGAHGDINLITLLLGAEEAGLELLDHNGEWLTVDPPKGALVVNIGDMLERLTNHAMPSTIHRVRNPDPARAEFSRYSMPFFLHPRSDFSIATLPGCITPENPDRYPEAITADEFLQERLREIGLKK